MNVYQETIEALARRLKTDIKSGLSSSFAKKKLIDDGPNRTYHVRSCSWLSIVSLFINQFLDPLTYLLVGAAGIIFFLGGGADACIIIGILLLSGIIGTIQESRTLYLIDQLNRLKDVRVTVIRDGKMQLLHEALLVVGDLVVLQAGERISADMRIIKCSELRVDESLLTGESGPIEKRVKIITEKVAINKQKNILFKGSYVLSGMAYALVIATGSSTYQKKLYDQQGGESVLPLHTDLQLLLMFVLWAIVILCIVLLMIGLITGKPFTQLLAVLTALFICVIPQGLPVIMTLVLVTGAHRMLKHHVLSKQLAAVEGIGRIDVMVLDKTGTLTRNELMVDSIVTQKSTYRVTGCGYFSKGDLISGQKKVTWRGSKDESLRLIGLAGKMLDHSIISYDEKRNAHTIRGDKIEAALGIMAIKLEIPSDKISLYKEMYEIFFDAKNRYHAAFYLRNDTGKGEFFCIGPHKDVCNCQKITTHKAGIMLAIRHGFFAIRDIPDDESAYKSWYRSLIKKGRVIGCVGLQDVLRDEAALVIDHIKQAGIRVVMATGDSTSTATYLSYKAGIIQSEDQVIKGTCFRTMTDEHLLPLLEDKHVYVGFLPDDKVRLIRLLQHPNHVVAMVGDGMNDVPALRAAQLGVCMGGAGSEAVRQAADIVLLDDNLSSLVEGIKEGRHILYTLRRVIVYFFTTNITEILVILCALVGLMPLPLLAVHVLWLNFVTDGILDTSLAMEPHETTILSRIKSGYAHRLIDYWLVMRILYMSLLGAILSLSIFWKYHHTLLLARTMTVVTLTWCQWFAAINCSSLYRSARLCGLWSNCWLFWGLILVFLSLVCMVHLPYAATLFKTVPLSIGQWIETFCVGLIVFLVEEIRKVIARHKTFC